MKKMISGLSLALCLGAILPVQATELEGASPWAVDIVQEAISSNIVPSHLRTGYQDAISRADFCALAVSTYEEATGGEIIGRKTFTDTNDVNVEKMADLGVVSGTSDEEFSPNRPLSREEAAVILTNLSETLGVPLSEGAISFDDNNEISSWATSAIGKVNQAGIMSGVGNSRFAPKDTYTREQSMITMLRVLESREAEGITPVVPEVTSPSISDEEISAIRIEALQQSTESVRYLNEATSHIGDASNKSLQGLALVDCTEGIIDLMESGTYAMQIIETLTLLLEVDDKYADMIYFLLEYSHAIYDICDVYLAQDPTADFDIYSPLDSHFLSMLTNLLLEINTAAQSLKQATDIFYQ